MTPEQEFMRLRELLHGAGIPDEASQTHSDRKRARPPTRRRALPNIHDVATVIVGALIVMILVAGWVS